MSSCFPKAVCAHPLQAGHTNDAIVHYNTKQRHEIEHVDTCTFGMQFQDLWLQIVMHTCVAVISLRHAKWRNFIRHAACVCGKKKVAILHVSSAFLTYWNMAHSIQDAEGQLAWNLFYSIKFFWYVYKNRAYKTGSRMKCDEDGISLFQQTIRTRKNDTCPWILRDVMIHECVTWYTDCRRLDLNVINPYPLGRKPCRFSHAQNSTPSQGIPEHPSQVKHTYWNTSCRIHGDISRRPSRSCYIQILLYKATISTMFWRGL